MAFKRPRRTSDSEAVARLRREIQEQSRIRHRHVMPILEHAEDFAWFTMPLAEAHLADRRARMTEDELVQMLEEAAQGLEAAHALGLVHRDVTPRNILLLNDDDGARWVVGDWGMVRRPRGLTSTMRTRPGDPFGTEGFVAPEVMVDAHAATASADVYSLGRVFGFALTGKVPVPGIAQDVPEKWRLFVRRLTDRSPTRRLQTMGDVRTLLRRISVAPVRSSVETISRLAPRLDAGAGEAADELLDLALAAQNDDELWLDHVATLSEELVRHLTRTRREDVDAALERVEHHLRNSWDGRSYDGLNRRLLWIFNVARAAQDERDPATFEEACRALFELEPWCKRYDQRRRTRAWLATLRDSDAEIVGRVLRTTPAGARWYLDEGWNPVNCDAAIRDALAAAAAEPDNE